MLVGQTILRDVQHVDHAPVNATTLLAGFCFRCFLDAEILLSLTDEENRRFASHHTRLDPRFGALLLLTLTELKWHDTSLISWVSKVRPRWLVQLKLLVVWLKDIVRMSEPRPSRWFKMEYQGSAPGPSSAKRQVQ